jgi:hypothetical protein
LGPLRTTRSVTVHNGRTRHLPRTAVRASWLTSGVESRWRPKPMGAGTAAGGGRVGNPNRAAQVPSSKEVSSTSTCTCTHVNAPDNQVAESGAHLPRHRTVRKARVSLPGAPPLHAAAPHTFSPRWGGSAGLHTHPDHHPHTQKHSVQPLHITDADPGPARWHIPSSHAACNPRHPQPGVNRPKPPGTSRSHDRG